MVALTATNWSVTATNVRINNKEKRVNVSWTLTSGDTATYPAGGIPLPTDPGTYGLVRNLDYILIYDQNSQSQTATSQALLYRFTPSGPAIQIYTPSGPAEIAGAPATATTIVIRGEVVGW